MLFKNSVNTAKFNVYLEELRAKFPFDDMCLYMDNLAVHKSKVVRERMDELSFKYIYGPAYSPDLNPIETVFSMAKGKIKKARLAAICNGYKIDIWKTVKDSFDKIEVLKIGNCIR